MRRNDYVFKYAIIIVGYYYNINFIDKYFRFNHMIAKIRMRIFNPPQYGSIHFKEFPTNGGNLKKNNAIKITAFILVCTAILFLGLYIKTGGQKSSSVQVSSGGAEQMASDELIRQEETTPEPRLIETSLDRDTAPATAGVAGSSTSRESGDHAMPDFQHLRLVGIATDAGNEPFAVIANESTGRQDLYRQGDKIEKATIVEISGDQAILGYEGRFVPLTLEKSKAIMSETITDPVSQNESKPVLVYIDEAEIERSWEETQELMTQIEVDQHLEQDQPKGVIVSRVTPGSVFEEIGLKPGDVIVKVDDMEMNIADDAMEIYNSLRTSESVTFTVIRQGEPDPVILTYQR